MTGVELVATRFAETRLNGHTYSDDRNKSIDERLNISSFSSEQTKHSLVAARLPRLKVGADRRRRCLNYVFEEHDYHGYCNYRVWASH